MVFAAAISCTKNTDPPGGTGSGGNGNGNPTDSSSNSTSLAYLGTSGRLNYNKFANQGETNKDNILPDFSHAGYMGGGVALPDVPVVKTINPVAGDNWQNIQQAINEVSNLPANSAGFRGAVLLTVGLYAVEGTLKIEKSGVVIRGSGQGSDGTIIKATKKAEHNLIEVNGSGSGLGELTATRTKITTSYLATGATTFTVQNPAGYAPGDNIAVERTPNNEWLTELDMVQYGWTISDYTVSHERRIVAVSGNKITINIPIVDPLQDRYGGGHIVKINMTGRISQSGVENMRLVSDFVSPTDLNHGWNGVRLRRAENCWVKQVTAQYFGNSCVTLSSQSVFNTIEECAQLDPKSPIEGGYRYSFSIEGGSFNLFQRCFTRAGRHDYVTGARLQGPNVFLDCYSTDTHNDAGPHQRWATGTLLDNIHAGEIHVENRKASGTGHGWAGAQTLFWNCLSYKGDVSVQSPKGAMNWAIGCTGLVKQGNGYFESWGVPVDPRSIYLAQLQDRLGSLAVTRTTTTQQRNGNIFNQLRDWAGNGKLQ